MKKRDYPNTTAGSAMQMVEEIVATAKLHGAKELKVVYAGGSYTLTVEVRCA